MFRHHFLFISVVIVSLFAAALVLAQPVVKVSPKQRIATSFPSGDGKLCLYNYHEDRMIETNYRKGDRYRQKGFDEIKQVFRSRSDKQEHVIDVELIELLDHLQEHFAADCVELISGYRSPVFNRELKGNGANVAEESLHMEGRAADIHLDEVTEGVVSSYVRSLGVGGVGYYPAFDFVHIDTGDVRRWDRPDRPGRLLMAIERDEVWQIMTDRNIYRPGDIVDVEVTNISQGPHSFNGEIVVEHFRRGRWKAVGTLPIPNDVLLAQGKILRTRWEPKEETAFGKFRMILPNGAVRSNEFYRKRL